MGYSCGGHRGHRTLEAPVVSGGNIRQCLLLSKNARQHQLAEKFMFLSHITGKICPTLEHLLTG